VAVERAPLALVVTDLRLPDGDGLDIVRAAQQTTPSPTPALVVTGFASEASRLASLAAGASGYMAKPFGAVALVSLVEGALRARPGP
jgi:two-component system response regulator PilR (NtrC family)